MRRLSLVALPLSLALSFVHAVEHHHEHAQGHASLHAHEHGIAQLDVVLEGTQLELALHGPAINLLGFEHFPTQPAEKAQVEGVRKALKQPLVLFSLPAQARCETERQSLNSQLFGAAATEVVEPEHTEIHAHYQFTCAQPAALHSLDLSPWFHQFPGTRRIQVQLIGPNGQQGHELTHSHPRLAF